MKKAWEWLANTFGWFFALILVILLGFIGAGIWISGKELLLAITTLSDISGRAAIILACIFFGVGWYCAHLRRTYESQGCCLSEEERPSIKWTCGPVVAWSAFVMYALADWDPRRYEAYEDNGELDLIALSIAVPVLVCLLVRAVATTYKHSQAMNKKRRLDRQEAYRQRQE
ncbi:hypothetical protein [Niveibacterium sp.]|uniref:hypothetical protein n=1 Tax=Niveibacterium sp. TaxID=2017444 RepID=UPI0035B01D79